MSEADEETDCIHGLDVVTCSLCRPRPKPLPVPDSSPFIARYDSHCSSCNLPIVAQHHRIVMRHHDWGDVAIHYDCAR